MATTEIAAAYVTIIPSLKGAATTISKELAGVDTTSAGTTLGNKLASGFSVAKVAVGNIVASVVTAGVSAIASSVDAAISRLDTLNNYPIVLQSLGFSSEEASASISKISDRLTGLPTALDDLTTVTQGFISVTDDVSKSTDLAIALNDMFLAGGQGSQVAASAMEQFRQVLSKGKPDLQDWKIMLQAAPGQMKQLAQSMLGPTATADDLYEALGGGGAEATISMEELMDAVIALDENGSDSFASFADQAKAATGGISTSMTNMGTAVTRGLANLINGINGENKNIAGIFSNITSLINSAFSAVQPVADKMGEWLDAAMNLESPIERIKDALDNVGLGGAWSDMAAGFDELKSKFTDFVGTISASDAIFASTAAALGLLVGPELITAFTGFAKTATDAFSAVKTGVVGMAETAQIVIMELQSGGIANVVSSLKASSSALGALLTPAGGVAVAVIALAAAFAAAYATNEDFRNTVNQVGQEIMAALMPAVNSIMEALGNLMTNVWPSLQNIFNLIINALSSIITALGPVLVMIAEVAATIIEVLLPIITTILTVAMNVVNSILTVVVPIVQAICGAIQGFMETLSAVVTGVLSTISAVWSAIWTGIQSVVTSILGGIQSFVSGMMADFTAAWENACNGAYNTVKTLKDNILNFFSNASSWLVDAGRWIIEGLWNGITGALSWFGDKLASVATFIVENKGPKAYDLKLLEPAGGWIMQGLSAGIENSLPGLKSTLDSVTDTIESLSPTASSAYTYAYDYAGVGSGYALGGTTYNVYVDGARINDDEGIQNNLLELLLAMKRKGEMNVG